MRHVVKRVFERAAVVSGMTRVASRANRTRALILMYHNVVPRSGRVAGDASLHLPREAFARQLDHLQATCEIVPLQSLVEDASGPGGRCRVAITFDDAYLGAVTLAVEELRARGAPATIFVPPGLLGQETWWDVLGAASLDGMRPAEREEMLERFQGRGEAIQGDPRWESARRRARLDPELRISNANELAQAASQPGITIGSHTWSHPNLTVVDSSTLEEELARSLAWLAERHSTFLPYVTYPYGLSSARVADAAARAGYRAGLLASGGWYPVPDDGAKRPFALPRFDVSAGLSLDGLRLRLAGFGLH